MGIDLREVASVVPKSGRGDAPVLAYAPPARTLASKWVRRIGWTFALLIGLVVLVPFVQYGVGYGVGVSEARRELSQNRATIYVAGYRRPVERFDPDTGLSTKSVAGCMVGSWARGRLQGHNSVVEFHIRRKGFPAYSRAAWAREISAIANHFEGQPASARVPLRSADAPIGSPDGRYSVSLSPWTCKAGDYCTAPAIVIKDSGGVRRNVSSPTVAFCVTSEVHILWGASGADIAFVRFSGVLAQFRYCAPPPGEDVYYGVLDLRDGTWLRQE